MRRRARRGWQRVTAVDQLSDPNEPVSRTALDVTLAYHQRSKHLPFRFAVSLGYMDWETQPDPFRRFEGAPTLPLELEPVGAEPGYETALVLGDVDPAPLSKATVSRLFHDALALSAWKEIPGTRWSLRVNPSSGNLHPTEGYLISGPIAGLHDRPASTTTPHSSMRWNSGPSYPGKHGPCSRPSCPTIRCLSASVPSTGASHEVR